MKKFMLLGESFIFLEVFDEYVCVYNYTVCVFCVCVCD